MPPALPRPRAGGPYDVITLGEALVRLTPPGLRRIEQAASLDLEIGGSESNVAVGLARLGLRVAWLSRLTDNPLGRIVERTIAGQGVDTSHLLWTDEDRVGLYFVEDARPPRAPRVTYDRVGSAMSRMRAGELPAGLFVTGAARWLHVSGITAALGPGAAETARRAVELAWAAGWGVSFDFNYRAKLWSPQDAAAGCEPLAAAADVLIVSRRDAVQVLGVGAAPEAAAAELSARYPRAIVVLTLSKDGAAGRTSRGQFVHQPAFGAEEVGRIGGGDAFAAGFLYAHLTQAGEGAAGEEDAMPRRLATALRWGAAVAALKYATPGDLPLIDRDAAEGLVRDGVASPLDPSAPGRLGDVMR